MSRLAEYTENGLADAFGIQRRTVSRLLQNVDPHRVEQQGKKEIRYYRLVDVASLNHHKPRAKQSDTVEPGNASLRAEIDYEELRRRKRENDEAEGLLAPVAELAQAFAQWSKLVKTDLDSLPGQLQDTAVECPKCRTQTEIDGRGRQRMSDTVDRCKNHLARLHQKLFE